MKGVYKQHRKYWFRFSWRGKQRFVNLRTESEIEAINKAMKILADPAPWITGSDLITNLLEDYLKLKKIRGVSESRIENISLRLNAFFRDYKVKHPTELTGTRITPWMDSHFTRNNKTGNEYLRTLAGFTRWLFENGHILKDPCPEIPRRKEKMSVRRRFLSLEECRKLLDSCSNADLKLCLYLSLHCGLRKGECLQVAPHWIDLGAKLLHVQASQDWQPKDRDNRTIPLTEEFAEFLKPYVNRSPYLVKPEKRQGKAVYRWEFRKPFTELCEETGIDCTYHDLRRTFASLHVSAGTSAYKVARWLGDGMAVVEKYYGHLIPSDDEINNAWK